VWVRLLSCLFIAATLLTAASCTTVQPQTGNTVTTGGSVTEAPNENKEYMEAVNYDADFKILSSTVSEEGGRHFSEFGGDIEADSIASEIFKRDKALEEKYNITFEIQTTVNWNTMLEQAYMSDDLLFHIATPGASNAVYSITNGYVADLNDYPHFDFTKDWWQTEAIEAMSVIGKNMMAIGDINLLAYDSVGIIFYSKTLAERLEITDLYDHVKAGTWTYETMMEYVTAVTSETSGDGEFGMGDTYGLTGGSYSALCFVYAGNYSFVEKDEDGIPTMKEDINDFVEYFQKVVYDHSLDYLIGYDKVKDDTNMFLESRQLFCINMLGYTADFRNQQINYGLLPLPKWNAEQEDYWTFPHQSASTTICISPANREYDMTSRVIEDMAYRSNRDVLSRYVEENLFFRSLNGDTDSYDTVLNLLRHLNCDIFFSYKAGITEILRGLMDAHDTNITSKFGKYSGVFKAQLESIVAGTADNK